jgi:hypothetical protein
LKPTKPQDIRRYNERMVQIANLAAEEIVRVHERDYSGERGGCSCILGTLEFARNFFAPYTATPTKSYTRGLVYFSDMIECCGTSPLGLLDFSESGYDSALLKVRDYSPDFGLNPTRLCVITSSSAPTRSPYVRQDKLKQIWTEIFRKVGFSKQQIDSCNFTSHFPDWLTERSTWEK